MGSIEITPEMKDAATRAFQENYPEQLIPQTGAIAAAIKAALEVYLLSPESI